MESNQKVRRLFYKFLDNQHTDNRRTYIGNPYYDPPVVKEIIRGDINQTSETIECLDQN